MTVSAFGVLRTYGHSGEDRVVADVRRVFGAELSVALDPAGPADNPPSEVYLVRHPVDVIWDQYRSTERHRGSFDEFLSGPDAPLAAWANHLRTLHVHRPVVTVVRYENYVIDPAVQLSRIGAAFGARLPRDLEVSWPDETSTTSAAREWSPEWLERLHDTAGDLLAALGYDQVYARPVGTRAARRALRYVSRGDNTGYGVAGRRCVQALVAAGLDVVWEPAPTAPELRRDQPTSLTPPFLASRYEPREPAEVTVLHTMPEQWHDLRTRLGDSTYIGHTVWELDRLPHVWDDALPQADRIWVPTEWNRRTFVEGGVGRPVDVLPHVVTNERAEAPPIELPAGVTVFTTVSTWHPRKRPDWTVEAFARAFTGADPVALVMKTPATTECWPAENDIQRMTWWQLMQVMRRHPDPPQVILVNDHWTDEQINGLITRSDCYVSLPASEGWGLGLFDAATFGVPVITTGYGGHLEYLGNDHPGLVPHGWTEIGPTESSAHLEPDMVWALPDLDAAAQMMRSVMDAGNPIVAAAPALAERLRTTYSPEAVGAIAVDLLEQLT